MQMYVTQPSEILHFGPAGNRQGDPRVYVNCTMCKFTRHGKLWFVLSEDHAAGLSRDRIYSTCPDCEHTVFISRWAVAPCMFQTKSEMRKMSYVDVTHCKKHCKFCIDVHFSPILLD